MGGQNTKQLQGQSLVQIDHPKFENAKILQQKGNISMITTMSIEQKEYTKWKQQIAILKIDPEYLLMPRDHQFSTKGFCGSTGTLTVVYDYFPYLLMEEIDNRKKRKSKFQQCELWFLLFSLSAAQIEMKKIFDSKVGDIRPQNIFINQEGQIKVSCLCSWPKESSGFEKTFQHQVTLLSPEDMNKLELGGMDDLKNYQSEMFSIGMTILGAALLSDFSDIYDLKKMKFRYQQANEYLNDWRTNSTYSQIFTAFVSNLCSFQPQKRLTQKELWSWINKYQEQIKNKDDFFIQHAPIKIEKEIQQLRGESNINMLQEQNHITVGQGMMHMPQHYNQQQGMPFQQKSIVFPFMQGLPDQRMIGQQGQQMTNSVRGGMPIPQMNTQMNLPPNMVMSPRDTLGREVTKNMVQSINHNIPTAESMYTPIPAELLQKQFGGLTSQGQFSHQLTGYLPSQLPMQSQLPGQLPPGVIASRGIQSQGFTMQGGVQGGIGMQGIQQRVLSQAPQQQFYPPNMMPMSPNNGNFVYTRRIIDPTNGGVVAEQRIGEDEYQRGMGSLDQPQQGDY